MRRLIPVAAILALAVVSCDYLPAIDYSSFADIPTQGMPADWQYDFSVTSKDSADVLSGIHDVVLVVRYTDDCHSTSITLNIEEISFNHHDPDSVSIEIPFFSEKGKPLGSGVYGIYEVADTLHKNIKIPDGYTISVSSPLPQETTSGVKAIGIVVTRK